MNDILFKNEQALVDETSLRHAYEAIEPELDALAPSEVQIINLDVSAAVALVLGVLPRLRAQRDALAHLPGFNIERFDKLETYAQALTYAHGLHLVATQPPDDLVQLQAEASKVRDLLYKDTSVAVARGWVAERALDDLKGANGYKNTALDIQILVRALQARWSTVEGRLSTTATELEYAEKLAFHLLRSYGEKKNGPEGTVETADRRHRAFTLLFKAYDDARQGVAFLRRQFGDADRFAPSLFTARASKRKSDVEAEPDLVAIDADAPVQASATQSASAIAADVPSQDPLGPFVK